MKQKKFPFIFGRQGGESIELLERFKTPETNRLLWQVADLSKGQEIKKDCIVRMLERKIGAQPNDMLKNTLINLKRDFFNGRKIGKYQELIQSDPDLEDSFEAYRAENESFENAKAKYSASFEKEFYQSIASLKQITEAFYIKNGLLFSSKIVYDEIKKTNFDFTSLNKKEKHLVLSTMKYLTRSITKTTPFSSFNSIFCLEEKEGSFRPIDGNFKSSNFQATNLFFYYLKEILMGDKTFRRRLRIACNSNSWTEATTAGHQEWHFFVNFENNEVFKKLPDSEVLQYINDQLKDEKTYQDLSIILQSATGQKQEEIEAYIDKLVDERYLISKYPVSNDTKNWIPLFIAFLKANFGPHELLFSETILILDTVLQTISELESTLDVSLREAIISEGYDKILAFIMKWNPESEFQKKVIAQDFVYEDTLAYKNVAIDVKNTDRVITALKETFSAINCVNTKEIMRKKLGKKMIAQKSLKLPILRFYEKIYIPFNEHEKIDTESSDFSAFKKSFQKIIHYLESKEAQSHDTVDISGFFKVSNEAMEDQMPFGVYLQSTDSTMNKIVINAFYNGHGANISRFLNFIPQEYADSVMEFNNTRQAGKIVAEIKDAAIHNVNTYPQMAKKILSIFEENDYADSVDILSLANLSVKVSEDGDLIIVNAEDTEVKAINFSLEGLKRKSKFVQFLDIFNPIDGFGVMGLLENLNKHFILKIEHGNIDIVFIPRVTYKEDTVLQRKTWLIKKEWFAKAINEKKSYAETFLMLHEMIANKGIPDEFFIKASRRGSKGAKDNYKPQYIDLKSPVFTLVLINCINQSTGFIEISEVFPEISGLKDQDGFVKEYLLNT